MATATSDKRDAMKGVIPSYINARSRTAKSGEPEFIPEFIRFILPIKSNLSQIKSKIDKLTADQKVVSSLYPKFFAANEKAISTIVRESELTTNLFLEQQKEFQQAVLAKLTGTQTATRAAGSKTRPGRRPKTGASRANRSRELTRTARSAVRSGRAAPGPSSTGDTSQTSGGTNFRSGPRRAEVLRRAKNIRSIRTQKAIFALKTGAIAGAGLGAIVATSLLKSKPPKPISQPQTRNDDSSSTRDQREPPVGSPQRTPQSITNLTGSKAEREQALINAAKQAGITDKTELAQFMAQWAHESGNFKYMQEIWGPTAAQSRYEGRRDLGNTQAGDGYRYRGRGFSQLTGRSNYRTIGNRIGVDLENNPDLASQPDIAAKIAIEYWKTRVKNKVSNFEDTRSVTYYVNGGYNGLDDRIAKFAAYKQKDFSVGAPAASVPVTDARGNIQSAARNQQTQTGAAGPSAASPPAGAATAVAFARSVLGLHERSNNQQLVDYMKAGGVSINPAKTAWCAAFVNASLARAGIKGTGSLAAGSFNNWGTAVTKPEEVQAGDVIVNRKRSPRTGLVGSHVALATGPAKNINGKWYIPAIDGNWSDTVAEHNEDSGYDFSTHNIRRAGASSLIPGFTPQALPSAPGTPTPAASSLSKESNVPVTDSSGTTGTATGTSSGYTSPVDGARISSKFGYRIHPIKKTRRMHTGVDYAARLGTPVKATADGNVVRAGVAGGYGNMVEIQHADGTTSRYAHLSAFKTSVGKPVKQGQVVGLVGSTGQSTGPHLHFEIRKNGYPIDPLGVLGGSAATVPAAEAANATEPIAGPGNTLAVPGPGGKTPAFSAPTMQMNPFVGSPLFGLAQMVSMMGGSGFAVQPIMMRQTNTIKRKIPVNSAPFASAPIALQGAASIFANIARMI